MFFILFFFIVRIIRLHLDSLVSFYVLLYLRSQPFKTCASSTFNSSMQPVSGMNILIIFFLGFLFRMCTNTIFKVVAQWDTFRCIIGCISTTRITSGGNKNLYTRHINSTNVNRLPSILYLHRSIRRFLFSKRNKPYA